jgi:hypothetical protein
VSAPDAAESDAGVWPQAAPLRRLWDKVRATQGSILVWATLQATPTPTPEPSPTIIQAPPASPLEIVGAVVAILFALVAGILGYRIIRGGRGL